MRAFKVCSCIGCDAHKGNCPELVPTGRCDPCAREAERKRGTASSRGYGSYWYRVIRPKYLVAHPICCLCQGPASVPDHYPLGRRELVARGVRDPDAWHRLRPLCKPCHDIETPKHQPGGWNVR